MNLRHLPVLISLVVAGVASSAGWVVYDALSDAHTLVAAGDNAHQQRARSEEQLREVQSRVVSAARLGALRLNLVGSALRAHVDSVAAVPLAPGVGPDSPEARLLMALSTPMDGVSFVSIVGPGMMRLAHNGQLDGATDLAASPGGLEKALEVVRSGSPFSGLLELTAPWSAQAQRCFMEGRPLSAGALKGGSVWGGLCLGPDAVGAREEGTSVVIFRGETRLLELGPLAGKILEPTRGEGRPDAQVYAWGEAARGEDLIVVAAGEVAADVPAAAPAVDPAASRSRALGALAVVALTAVLLVVLLIRSATAHLPALSDRVKQISLGRLDLSARLPGSPAEHQELVESIERLRLSLQKLMARHPRQHPWETPGS